MDFENRRKASRLRLMSRLFGYGSVIIAAALVAFWNLTTEASTDFIRALKDTARPFWPLFVKENPDYSGLFKYPNFLLLVALGVGFIGVVIGIVLRVISHKANVRGQNLVPTASLPSKLRKKIDKAQRGVSKKTNKTVSKKVEALRSFYYRNSFKLKAGTVGFFGLVFLALLAARKRKKKEKKY